MSSPLIENMIKQYEYPVLEKGNIQDFLESNETVVLFCVGDPTSFPESNDVAMILPEVEKAFHDRFKVAVISAEFQHIIQARYRFRTWPTLVFLRHGNYLGAISRVQDWADYLNDISQILAAEPSEPPEFEFKKAASAIA